MNRVKINGKAQSKFDLCVLMGYWRDLPWTVMCDAFDFNYIASEFEKYAAARCIDYVYEVKNNTNG